MNILYSLPKNILQKINFAQQDYIGLQVNPHAFIVFFTSLIFAILTVFISYSLGKKILSLFKDTTNTGYNYLVSIAIGYILIGSGIAILGLLSVLNLITVTLYLIFITLCSFLFPFLLKENLISFLNCLKNDFIYLKRYKFVFIWTVLFIFIALLNLINPEIREDQYHTDLPTIYLINHTIMIPPHERINVSASPLLSEMYFIPGILYISKESARYIHFSFYILIILTLVNFSRLKKYKFAIYTPVLFTSAPVVIHETSSMYVDFQWIFCFLLSILLLLDLRNNKFSIAKAGLLFGGVIATKLWTVVFLAPFISYLLTMKGNINKRIVNITIFFLFALLVSAIWLIRSYVLTGNPLHPAFSNVGSLKKLSFLNSLSYFVGINYPILNIFSYINVFSPLFFVSFIFMLYKIKTSFKIILKLKLFRYLFFLFVLYLLIHYPFGRYLLALYVVFIFLNSYFINAVYNKFKFVRILLNCVLIPLFSYYLVSSILVLPYAVGISDKNSYLTRMLLRDNSSYYDFGRKFGKFISNKDLVATYEVYGFYYANFNYVYADYIFSKTKNFSELKKYGITKLFIKGKDIYLLCHQNNLINCGQENYKLLSKYTPASYPQASYYLYEIK